MDRGYLRASIRQRSNGVQRVSAELCEGRLVGLFLQPATEPLFGGTVFYDSFRTKGVGRRGGAGAGRS